VRYVAEAEPLFVKCVEINMYERKESRIVLELGDWFKKNPNFPATVDDEEEFIDCEPDDPEGEWAGSGETISLPLDGFDMPAIGDEYRLTVERIVAQ
jgi:hypothetical protein